MTSTLMINVPPGAGKTVMIVDESAMMAPFKPEKLDPIYRLTWIEATLHDAPSGALATEYERVRDFKHLGGAISWARRRIFHGHTFGDVIEMHEVHRTRYRDGSVNEETGDPVDITLPGFVRWVRPSSFGEHGGYHTGKAERTCKWDQ